MLVPHIILVMNGAAVACRTLEILKADASDAGSRQSRDPVAPGPGHADAGPRGARYRNRCAKASGVGSFYLPAPAAIAYSSTI